MAVNISAWSIKRPLPAVVFGLVLLALGWASFNKLPITRLPNVDLPVISVIITQFGAAPAELESQVTKTVEDAVSGVEGVRHITSTVTDGVSATVIMFRLETNTDRALNDIKDAITRIRGNLSRNIDEPLIQRVDIVGLPIVTYAAIAAGKTPEQLSFFVDDVVKRKLQGARGVGQVQRIGGVDREILVSLDPDKLQAVGLTAADVSRRLRGNSIDLAGGRAELGGTDQTIRTLAGARTLAELAGTMISLPKGGEIRLDDLGTVTDTIAEPRTFARLDGKPIVAFSVLRSKGASDVTVAENVSKVLDEIKASNPDVDLKRIDTSVEYTLGNYESAMSTLFEGAALAVIVVFIFLRDLRATVIAAIALPLSIMPAFWVMDVLGFSLNMVSLLAITLATGILVDDAIVEIENIVRHIRMGKTPYQAAIDAADEIGLAVIAISLTIVAVFAPVSFMGSIAGQFFKQFGLTVSAEVLFSLLAARLITPMLAAYFLTRHQKAEVEEGPIVQRYGRLVQWSIEHRYLTVLIGLVLFVLSILSTKLLPSNFLPAQDTARSLLAVELPAGAQLSDTQRVTENIVTHLKTRPEIQSVFIDGGRIPPSTMEVRKAALVINYTPKTQRSQSVHQLELAIGKELEDVPDIHYWFLDDNGQRPVSLIVTGADGATVSNFAAELAARMRTIPLVTNVVAATSLDRPELLIKPKRDLAARIGVSTEGLSETLRIATIGDFGPALAKFNTGNQLVPIRVQLAENARTDRQVLGNLRVPTGSGGSIPLQSIANIELSQGPISIARFDRERQATLQADLVGNSALGDAITAIYDLPIMKQLPPGISVKQAGDAETMAELFGGFADAMRDGLMMVYSVLVLLFGSFLQPVTILFSLPLSIGGAILGLLVTGRPLSMPVIIGILMLMGIVTKNAIMLVDFTIEAIASGMDRTLAIVEAGKKRARPIIMTTVAMVAGMAPSALAIGAGGEFRSPMAIAVIGGLIVSTLLSLLFVPAFFAMMDDISGLIVRSWNRFTILEGNAPEESGEGPDKRSDKRPPQSSEGQQQTEVTRHVVKPGSRTYAASLANYVSRYFNRG
ncbi:efflux RND transporter permease subunit [Methyloferula stellata]|uniref:efflux RND transporter permease subunit n=1 Tax=Methyloferula stellata TaxID=876270 RepID=UPI00035E6A9A|nr:efflux RND transporter permease subunit [Methyloferula stellata]